MTNATERASRVVQGWASAWDNAAWDDGYELPRLVDMVADAIIEDRTETQRWRSVEELPEHRDSVAVLIQTPYKRIVRSAVYIQPKTEESLDGDWFEYDEEKDRYWLPGGWYQHCEYADSEFDLYFIDDEVLGWHPLPLQEALK